MGVIAAAQGTGKVSGGAAGLPDPAFCTKACWRPAARQPAGCLWAQLAAGVGLRGWHQWGMQELPTVPQGSMPPRVCTATKAPSTRGEQAGSGVGVGLQVGGPTGTSGPPARITHLGALGWQRLGRLNGIGAGFRLCCPGANARSGYEARRPFPPHGPMQGINLGSNSPRMDGHVREMSKPGHPLGSSSKAVAACCLKRSWTSLGLQPWPQCTDAPAVALHPPAQVAALPPPTPCAPGPRSPSAWPSAALQPARQVPNKLLGGGGLALAAGWWHPGACCWLEAPWRLRCTLRLRSSTLRPPLRGIILPFLFFVCLSNRICFPQIKPL